MAEAFFTPSKDFVRRTREVHGPAGDDWIKHLPRIITDCSRQWALTVGPPFQPLSYNYVAPATRADGTPAVLKICFPDHELLRQVEALRLFDGRGAVQLWEADAGRGALLLERLEPGGSLAEIPDDEAATAVAAGVIRRLWRPLPESHSFPSVADWAAELGALRERFGGTSGPLPIALVNQAEALFAELISSMSEPVLLHGDLHHQNILSAKRQPWLAIDPKGLIGERAYEVGALLRNPMPRLLTMDHPGRVLARRIEQLGSELGLDRARIHGWGLAQAVLAAWWALEDHGTGWEPWIACANLLADL